MNDTILKKIITVQKSEITEHEFYKRIANKQKAVHNKELLHHISEVEMTHYDFWKEYSNLDVKPNMFHVIIYYFIVVLFGLTFGIRLMENSRKKIKKLYIELSNEFAGLDHIIQDEHEHEQMHIDEIDEERLKYISSIVLGLNDALVEFTGSIAGFTFALASTKMIALAGLIAGIAAALSMASSEYLAQKQTESTRGSLISAFYTGSAYLIAVFLMILPYLLLSNHIISLLIMVFIVITIIVLFNFYISVAKCLSFKKRFLEMVTISLGVATLSFLIGLVVRNSIGIVD